jgi:cyclic dehypoxanthinyl futalosine synthase
LFPILTNELTMQLADLYQKALQFEFLSIEEGMFLFEQAPLTELMYVADEMRKKHVPHNKVTWQIDRNVNTTNVCIANCKFCNFYRIPGHADAYITDMPTYRKKIEETFKFGGDQLLLQGGHHPGLGLDFYTKTFRAIKQEYPNVKLHSLGPPEVAHICQAGKNESPRCAESLTGSGS